MSEAAHHELVIVKRHEEEEHEHHSSAWKVAHADFMTAMMAFFLIMWLINVTDDQIRKGISQYFNPIRLSEGSTDLKGLNKPEANEEGKRSGKRGHNDQASKDVFNPMKLSQGHSEAKEIAAEDGAGIAEAKAEAEAEAAGAPDAGAGEAAGGKSSVGGARDLAGAGPARDREQAAFQDPYGVLDKLAKDYSREHALSVDAIEGDDRPIGIAGGEVDRDPFDPVYWQLAPTPPARTEKPGHPGSAEAITSEALLDAAAASGVEKPAELVKATPEPDKKPEAASPAPKPLVVELEPAKQAKADAMGEVKTPEAAVKSAEALSAEIATAAAATLGHAASPQLQVKATKEGVVIDLTDDIDFAMFDVGSAIPSGKMVVLIEKIAAVLSSKPGTIVLRGFTDARPFRSETYDNWRLSAARAHMAFYMLTRGGLDERRVVAIEGHADRAPRNTVDPYAAENRRIEILLKEAGEP